MIIHILSCILPTHILLYAFIHLYIYQKLPLLLVANMQVSHTAMTLFLLHNNASSDAKSVTEILLTMAEMEDSNTNNHALSRTLKKAQRQEERSLDEITEVKVDEKADADAGVLAQVGTPCVYSNGTQGIKCVGYFACASDDDPVNIDRIACGSCIGDYSCYELSNTDVGEQSCIGRSSCILAYNASIGSNSCNGDKPCNEVNDVKIGNDSCNGFESCYYADNVEIGNNSCNGFKSCYEVDDAEIGNNSCVGEQSCFYADNVEIGNNSCVGEESCYAVSTFDTARIKIGNNSCIKDYACIDVDYDVGQDSCNGFQSCRLISGKKFANQLTI